LELPKTTALHSDHSRETLQLVLLLCVQLPVLAIALCKNFSQMFSCLCHSDRRKREGMGHVPYYQTKTSLHIKKTRLHIK